MKKICHCPSNYQGPFCAEDVDECLDKPCKNGGICLNRYGDFLCDCSNTKFIGKFCDVIETPFCDGLSCFNNVSCLNDLTRNFTSCNCSSGVLGRLCSIDIDECHLAKPCKNGGTCVNTHGSFACTCNSRTSGKFCEKTLPVVSFLL